MLNACLYGAKHVTAVDISEHAIETAKRNAELNGFTNVDFVVANAFDYLRECVQKGKNGMSSLLILQRLLSPLMRYQKRLPAIRILI